MTKPPRISASDFIRLAQEEAQWTLTHPQTGRMFGVRMPDEQTYFLEEYRPGKRLYAGQWGTESFRTWIDDRLVGLLRDVCPNDIYEAGRALGIDWEDVLFGGSGYGIYSRGFDSLEGCAAAVNEAVAANEWYTAQDEALKADPAYQRQLRETEVRERAELTARLASAQAAADVANHGLFQGCANLYGPLDKERQQAILAYLNAPSEPGWEAIAHSIITPVRMGSLWQAWCEIDPQAPRSKPSDGPWPRWPTPEMLRKAIRAAVDNARQEIAERANEKTVPQKPTLVPRP